MKVYQGSDQTLDLTIGKFSFSKPRNMSTFVRVADDDNVYEVNGMLSFTFDHNQNFFRDNYLINSDHSAWTKLSFNYPSDSSFVLEKTNGKWMIGGKLADSTKVMNYLSSLSHFSSTNFVDDFDQSILTKPVYSISIETKSPSGEINISAFQNSNLMLLHSNLNSESYFDGNKNKTWEKVFKGKKSLLK